jgi:hypothetical protein
MARTRKRLNGFPKYMNKMHNIDHEDVNNHGRAFCACNSHLIRIKVCGSGGCSVQLRSFIGKETHGDDAALLLEVLQ